jgi:hypothetical protein
MDKEVKQINKGIHAGHEVAEGMPTSPDYPLDGDYGDDTKSGCPGGGGVEGGICKPYTNEHRSTWMSTYTGCRDLRVNDAILPGTHNSGMDKQASYQNSLATCQDVSPFNQLMTGIRVLDLRTQFYSGYPLGDHRRFMIFHDLNSGRTIEGDILSQVLNFRKHLPLKGDPQREIIILDFHEFKDFTEAAHWELAGVIKNTLGSIIVDPWMSSLTLSQLWQFGNFGVVIAYNADPRDRRFWYRLNQRWIGSNTPSTDELKDFMNRVASESKPHDELRSVQCAKYNKLVHTPDDFSDKIRQWFYADSQSSYILGFYVINTDWSLRQRLIDNCIHGNTLRLNERIKCTDFYVTQNDGEIILASGFRAMIVRVADGHWARAIRLPQDAIDWATIMITSSAAHSCEIMTGNTDYPADRMSFHTEDVVAFCYNPATRKWQTLGSTYLADAQTTVVPVPTRIEKLIHFQMNDAHWASRISLPSPAPDQSVVHIESTATLQSQLSGENLETGADLSIPTGFSGAFMFRAESGKWRKLSKAPEPPPPPLPAPENFGVDNDNTRTIDTFWDPVPRAAKYELWHWVPGAWAASHVADTTQTSHRKSLGFLPPLDRGARWVIAVDASGVKSARSNLAYYERAGRVQRYTKAAKDRYFRFLSWLRRLISNWTGKR